MKKVPYFAGCLLAMGSAVVALNWDPAAPANTPAERPLPVTAPDWMETVRLYSAFGPETKPIKPTEPEQLSDPKVKLLPQTPIKAEPRLTRTTPRSTMGNNPKKRPSPSNASGHIL